MVKVCSFRTETDDMDDISLAPFLSAIYYLLIKINNRGICKVSFVKRVLLDHVVMYHALQNIIREF